MSRPCKICGGLIMASNEVMGYGGPICNGLHATDLSNPTDEENMKLDAKNIPLPGYFTSNPTEPDWEGAESVEVFKSPDSLVEAPKPVYCGVCSSLLDERGWCTEETRAAAHEATDADSEVKSRANTQACRKLAQLTGAGGNKDD